MLQVLRSAATTIAHRARAVWPLGSRRCQVQAGGLPAKRLSAALVFLVMALLAPASPARADGVFPLYWRWSSLSQPCRGDCAVALYGGRHVSTHMTSAFGIDNYTPINRWEYGDGGLIAGTVSRRFASIGSYVDFELEGGIGQRFGNMDQTEFWGAIFVRWVAFPWNHYLRTTIAASTGLNYATGISDFERERSGNNEGSRLLHFLSPEITFALPSRPDIELLLRFHHRSGGRDIFGPIDLFNGVNGGAHYGTVGLRYRF